ncbi:hypothetical protein D7X32_00270 [Corallococcus carmarthensis]|uniref:Uncharacterized protein n=2 Tax=Corallococcus carmarthensis TaxID=2316728 RepID=A0A3A8KUD5_9BACT|nr:hypothetical protein D7X32_00270 [Corallococcus carmarthensis]
MAAQVNAWLAQEQEGIRWSRVFWRNSVHELIREKLTHHRWSIERFENLVTYGSAERVRQLGQGGMFFGDPLEWDLGIASCGVTANQLALAVLGRAEGNALVNAATAALRMANQEEVVTQGGITSGGGIDNLENALSVAGRRLAIVNFGPSHRLLLEKGPCSAVELLQSWYDPQPGHGYTFARWFRSADSRLRHTVGGFIMLLRVALTEGHAQRAAATKELFAPVGSNFNEVLNSNVRPTFSIRDVQFQQLKTSLTNFCNQPASIFG